jgi:hypothetical protein
MKFVIIPPIRGSVEVKEVIQIPYCITQTLLFITTSISTSSTEIMNSFEYRAITTSPLTLFSFLLIVIYIFCVKTSNTGKFIDGVVFNVFPDILKTKKDDNNQTVVYFRKERLLLEGELLVKVKKELFRMFSCLFLYITYGFGQFLFLEYSYNCDDVHAIYQITTKIITKHPCIKKKAAHSLQTITEYSG